MAIILDGSTGISSIGTLTGVTSISSASANTPVILGDSGTNYNTCRAWINFDGTGTPAIRGSFNVSSITDNGTGDYTINFTTVMPDANYAVTASCSNASSGANFFGNVTLFVATSGATSQAPTTSAFRFIAYNNVSSLIDPQYVNVSVFR